MTKQLSSLVFFLIINQNSLYPNPVFKTFITKLQSSFGTNSNENVILGNNSFETYINGQSVFINGTNVANFSLTSNIPQIISESNSFGTAAASGVIIGKSDKTITFNGTNFNVNSTGNTTIGGSITATNLGSGSTGTLLVLDASNKIRTTIDAYALLSSVPNLTTATNFGTNVSTSVNIGKKSTGINTNITGDKISLDPNIFSLSTYNNTAFNPSSAEEIYLNSKTLSSGTIFGVGKILGVNKASALLTIDASGKLGITALTSSRNFKHNIQDASVLINNTNLLDKIHPVTFSYNDKSFGSNETYAGLIAEDLVGTPFEFAILKTDEGTIYGIDYNSIFSCMIQFIKYQKQQIDQQQNAINQILTRIATLENK